MNVKACFVCFVWCFVRTISRAVVARIISVQARMKLRTTLSNAFAFILLIFSPQLHFDLVASQKTVRQPIKVWQEELSTLPLFHTGRVKTHVGLTQVVPTPAAAVENDAFDEYLAHFMARVVAVSYCEPLNILAWNCTPCQELDRLHVQQVVSDRKDTFQGYVSYDRERASILVAFRGSRDIGNWIDNLTFYRTRAYPSYPHVLVHAGFHKAYESVAQQVVDAVHRLRQLYVNATIHVTGHSLGAAVAALCAFDLTINQQIRVDSMTTFGQPRVGNEAFATVFHELIPKHWRITHWRDVVPHIPQVWIGYHHLFTEVFYNEDSSWYRVCNGSSSEDPLCSDICSPFSCDSILDHLTYLNVTLGHLIC